MTEWNSLGIGIVCTSFGVSYCHTEVSANNLDGLSKQSTFVTVNS